MKCQLVFDTTQIERLLENIDWDFVDKSWAVNQNSFTSNSIKEDLARVRKLPILPSGELKKCLAKLSSLYNEITSIYEKSIRCKKAYNKIITSYNEGRLMFNVKNVSGPILLAIIVGIIIFFVEVMILVIIFLALYGSRKELPGQFILLLLLISILLGRMIYNKKIKSSTYLQESIDLLQTQLGEIGTSVDFRNQLIKRFNLFMENYLASFK
ncbi:MAG: hypothetical protein KGZ58_00840 [Ignavibacteriales bacterium]|nr:hypothetical protein [Ignavibacteriales bacterium]